MTSCHHHSHHGPKGELPPIGKGKILFQNCSIFDGVNEALLQGRDVLVEENLISKIVPTGSETFDLAEDGVVLDCEGHTLMPGLIDCHWHSVLSAVSVQEALTKDLAYLGIKAASLAGDTLLRGFTTVRDVGATPFGIKEATDEGIIKGPRLYNTGPFISQTAGHFDYRPATATWTTWPN